MNDYSYKPSRNSKLVSLILILIGVAHLLLMAGADSVLTSIQGNLMGRKVITVEIFGEERGKANTPAPELKKLPSMEPNRSKDSAKSQRALLPKAPPAKVDPTSESGSLAPSDLKTPSNEVVPSNNSQVLEADRPSISVDKVELSKQANVSNESIASDTGNKQAAVQEAPDSLKIELPRVGALKAPQNYTFEVFQGEASEAKSVGRIKFDLEVNNSIYQSRFAIRFSWVTRLIAEDREWISQGRVDDFGLKPQKVIEQRGKRSPKTIVLDHQTAVGNVADITFPIQAGLQDRTSIIWQFSLLARSNPEKYARGIEFDFPLLVSSKMVASKWRSKLETINIAGRNIEAIHFVRTDMRDDDVRFEFWLSSELEMSPVKLTISDGKGRKFDVVREKLS
jgi:Protein of unknown function (DUF3108)